MIIEELGHPPMHCYPIYLITVGSGDNERIVYIGKTSSNKGRFSGGHRAGLLLHNPKYNRVKKSIYFCCVVFLSERNELLPLEWINPLKKALLILDSVESHLIWGFSPELNEMKKKSNLSKYDLSLHVHNFSGESDFLNDIMI